MLWTPTGAQYIPACRDLCVRLLAPHTSLSNGMYAPPGAGIFLGNGPEMAKKKPLKAAKLVKHAARKAIGQPKATRAERSRIEKFKGGRVSKKKGEETKEYDSHE